MTTGTVLVVTAGVPARFPFVSGLRNPVVVTAIPSNSGRVLVGTSPGGGVSLAPGPQAVPDPVSGTCAAVPGTNSVIQFVPEQLGDLIVSGAIGDGVSYQTNG